MPLFRVAWSLIRQRCPRCHVGPIFRGSISMNDPCPHCGLVFQREEGYFLGAMYVSYGLSVLVIGVLYWTLLSIWPRLGALPVLGIIVILYAPFVPIVFRYSRVIWMYFDRAISPTDVSAGIYEKARQLDYQQHAGER